MSGTKEVPVTAEDRYLKFAHRNIGCIIGYEDATFRVDLEREFKVADRFALRSPKDHTFGYAVVEDVYEARVGQGYFDAVFVDGRSAAAGSDDEMLTELRRHYGRDVTFDTEVTVIYFQPVALRTPVEIGLADGEADQAEPINPVDQAARDILRATGDPEVERLARSIRTMERNKAEGQP